MEHIHAPPPHQPPSSHPHTTIIVNSCGIYAGTPAHSTSRAPGRAERTAPTPTHTLHPMRPQHLLSKAVAWQQSSVRCTCRGAAFPAALPPHRHLRRRPPATTSQRAGRAPWPGRPCPPPLLAPAARPPPHAPTRAPRAVLTARAALLPPCARGVHGQHVGSKVLARPGAPHACFTSRGVGARPLLSRAKSPVRRRGGPLLFALDQGDGLWGGGRGDGWGRPRGSE